MSEKMWDATYKHASTCDMGNKLYLAQGSNYTLLLNPICQVVKAVVDGEVYPIRNLNTLQRVSYFLLHIYFFVFLKIPITASAFCIMYNYT